jgi:hypothetical protein
MMGVYDDEIEEVSDNGKRPDLRIIGFDEEEQRLRQRSSGRPQISLKLPQGQYIFCDFRTLHLPGIEVSQTPCSYHLCGAYCPADVPVSFTVPCLNYLHPSPQ